MDLQSTAGTAGVASFSRDLVGVSCQATAEAERWDASQNSEVIEADDEPEPRPGNLANRWVLETRCITSRSSETTNVAVLIRDARATG